MRRYKTPRIFTTYNYMIFDDILAKELFEFLICPENINLWNKPIMKMTKIEEIIPAEEIEATEDVDTVFFCAGDRYAVFENQNYNSRSYTPTHDMRSDISGVCEGF